MLQKWSLDFSRDSLPTARFPLWIVLHGVPMGLFSHEGLARIASAVGVPLYLDKSSELRRRLDIAKVCVEVERDAPLPASIEVNIEGVGMMPIAVDYPWRPETCSGCKGFGHNISHCNAKEVWMSKGPKDASKNGASVPQTAAATTNGGTSSATAERPSVPKPEHAPDDHTCTEPSVDQEPKDTTTNVDAFC